MNKLITLGMYEKVKELQTVVILPSKGVTTILRKL